LKKYWTQKSNETFFWRLVVPILYFHLKLIFSYRYKAHFNTMHVSICFYLYIYLSIFFKSIFFSFISSLFYTHTPHTTYLVFPSFLSYFFSLPISNSISLYFPRRRFFRSFEWSNAGLIEKRKPLFSYFKKEILKKNELTWWTMIDLLTPFDR